MSTQNYGNHTRYVPGFHLILGGLVTLNLSFSISRAWRMRDADSMMGLMVASSLVLLFWYTREFALGVQNRVIRLEMLARLQRVLPAELAARVADLRLSHLIALRFAPDRELEPLVREVLAGTLQDATSIKRRIKDWQADPLRI